MQFRPRQLLPSCASVALLAAASLTLPACTDTGYVSGGSATSSSSSHYQVSGRYYHCHPSGVCHNSRHPNFYYHGGYYRQRPYHRYQRPAPPPDRPRPY